jgi:hypothetical protein
MEINVHPIIQSVNDYRVYKNNLSISVSIGSSCSAARDQCSMSAG